MSPAGSEFNRKKKLTTRDVTFNSYMMYGVWGLGVGVGVGVRVVGCGGCWKRLLIVNISQTCSV